MSERVPPDPEDTGAGAHDATQTIAAGTTMGTVELSVADLGRSIAFYRAALGLEMLERGAGRATLGVGERPLLVMVEQPGARPAPRHTGLFHVALLLPERRDLAGWLAHAARERVQLVGLSDHFVSEAIYLSDPDEHGLEVYWDRPRSVWEGKVGERLTTLPLDTGSLLRELDDPATADFGGMPRGTTVGHVHFKVAAIPESIHFYRDVLGLGLMAQLGVQAAFLSAGGYHHHVGANTWESSGASPPPAGAAALRSATIVLPDADERDRVAGRISDAHIEIEDASGGALVRDPSGNALVLAA